MEPRRHRAAGVAQEAREAREVVGVVAAMAMPNLLQHRLCPQPLEAMPAYVEVQEVEAVLVEPAVEVVHRRHAVSPIGRVTPRIRHESLSWLDNVCSRSMPTPDNRNRRLEMQASLTLVCLGMAFH